jgi:hypothetical protein
MNSTTQDDGAQHDLALTGQDQSASSILSIEQLSLLEEARSADRAFRTAEEELKVRSLQRQQAFRTANKRGIRLLQIAEVIEISPQRVQQLVSECEALLSENPLDIEELGEINSGVEQALEQLEIKGLTEDGNPRAFFLAELGFKALAETNVRIKKAESALEQGDESIESSEKEAIALIHRSDYDKPFGPAQLPEFLSNSDFRHLVMECCSNPVVSRTFDPKEGTFERTRPEHRRQRVDLISDAVLAL